MYPIKRTSLQHFLGLVLLIIGLAYFGVKNNAAQAQTGIPTSSSEIENEENFTDFEARLETVRQTLKIPGMSAAVVKDQQLLWAAGFGYADLESQTPATADTPYGLASVTKPVAAVLIMQLVEEGLVDLDAPVKQYGVNLVGDIVSVRHLMTHTSEGVPGTEHDYNGSRYGHLGGVIESVTGKTFAENLSERFLLPLDMKNTATNPINFWGGSHPSGLRDFQPALGWGQNFRHYPDVYAQLAKPYQFDDQYNLIPGMYQIYHNPAAGMLSSVTDLAKFDIALDQGFLLGETAKAEMLSPAVSTYQGRQDLMYGLGWYVQDFDGTRLLWHTGRWSPSTSALYLKIPGEDLTFIVLANTANLSTPFDALGCGDISKSLLALSFYEYFVFPEKYGTELPVIDWSAAEGILVDQLAEIEDQPTREFLERELWAFRQAYASAGEKAHVEKLRRVNLRAFPDSNMRRDGFFTNTVGAFPIIQPGLSASAFMQLSWGVLIWLILVLLSLGWITISLLRSGRIPKSWCIFWLLSTIFLGPIAVFIYTRFQISAGKPASSGQGLAWTLAAFLAAVYATGWAVAFSFLVRLGNEPHPLAILGIFYLTPLLVGFVFFQVPALLSWRLDGIKQQIPARLWHSMTSMNIAFAVMFPLMMFFDQVLTTIPGSFNPFYWAILSNLALVNLVAQYPINCWMIRRGTIPWNPNKLPIQGSFNPPEKSRTWPVFLTSLLVMIASIAITILIFES